MRKNAGMEENVTEGETIHLRAMEYCGGNLNYYPFDKPEYAKGYSWVKKQAEAGDPKSQYQYARIICYADGPFLEAAVNYWEKAYAGGCVMAAVELGDLYADVGFDWGVPWLPDEEKALHWFGLGADDGNMYSADRAGEIIYERVWNEIGRLRDMGLDMKTALESVRKTTRTEQWAKYIDMAVRRGMCTCASRRQERGFMCPPMTLHPVVEHPDVDELFNSRQTKKENCKQWTLSKPL